ncbi:MAG TPA: ATP-grasp domain-containing protein [Bryobacteraceae bacterium]|nr:ATP-grasp domain-containing protein [Bryobacteraceae bacterium]
MKVLVLFDLARAPSAGETFSPEVLQKEEDKQTEADVLACLQRLGHEVETLAVFSDVASIIDRLKTFAPDVVFNLTESFHSNRAHEPNIPALLELMKMRYTGARPDGLMLCKDKALAKKVLAYHRVRVPHFVISTESRPLKRLRRFVFPAFIKPVSEESSDGISRASFARSEEEALERARFIQEKFHCDALIEEYIEGRELYLSVMGNRKLTVFPPREIFFDQVPADEPKFATYQAKWNDAYRKKWGIQNGPARELPAGVEEKLARLARKVYRALKIQGFGRIDVRLTGAGEIVTIEANPNPSLAREDDFAQAAGAAGVDYDTLIQKILDSA